MQAFGLEITRGGTFGLAIRRVRSQTFSGVDSNYGWYGIVREPYAGGFQSGAATDAPRSLLAFSAVFSCITLIAADIAKMRIKLVARTDEGVDAELTASPFMPVLRKPNRYQTRIKFIEQGIVSKLLYGNVYALKERDALEAMWFYYRDNRTKLSRDIGKHRDAIVEQLKQGLPAEQVFAPFVIAPPSHTGLR